MGFRAYADFEQFDEFDSEDDGLSGQEFPSDLEVSDEEDEEESGEEDQPARPKAAGKPPAAANGKAAIGTKRKAPAKDPKKGGKRSESSSRLPTVSCTDIPAGPKVEVEYEMETEPMSRETLRNW